MWGLKRHAAQTEQQCSHARALPRWDNVDDEGKLDRVTRWYCPTCDRFVSSPAGRATNEARSG